MPLTKKRKTRKRKTRKVPTQLQTQTQTVTVNFANPKPRRRKTRLHTSSQPSTIPYQPKPIPLTVPPNFILPTNKTHNYEQLLSNLQLEQRGSRNPEMKEVRLPQKTGFREPENDLETDANYDETENMPIPTELFPEAIQGLEATDVTPVTDSQKDILRNELGYSNIIPKTRAEAEILIAKERADPRSTKKRIAKRKKKSN